jgi:hypothetical protein
VILTGYLIILDLIHQSFFTMHAKRAINLSTFLVLAFSMAYAQSVEKLLGTWGITIDYESYRLEFISDTQLVLNGETQHYSIAGNNIVVGGQSYPYAFRGDDLFITADGVEYKLTRTGDGSAHSPLNAALMGSWENKDEYVIHRLTFHSGSQAEYDGEWVGFTIRDDAFVVDYEHYPFKLEGEVLMIKWPGESDYRKFTRVQD